MIPFSRFLCNDFRFQPLNRDYLDNDANERPKAGGVFFQQTAREAVSLSDSVEGPDNKPVSAGVFYESRYI